MLWAECVLPDRFHHTAQDGTLLGRIDRKGQGGLGVWPVLQACELLWELVRQLVVHNSHASLKVIEELAPTFAWSERPGQPLAHPAVDRAAKAQRDHELLDVVSPDMLATCTSHVARKVLQHCLAIITVEGNGLGHLNQALENREVAVADVVLAESEIAPDEILQRTGE